MPPRRDLSSQTGQANDEVPPQFDNVGPMSAKGFTDIWGLLLGWLSVRLKLLRLMGKGNLPLLGVAPLMILRG